MGRREGLKILFGITECRFESGSEHLCRSVVVPRPAKTVRLVTADNHFRFRAPVFPDRFDVCEIAVMVRIARRTSATASQPRPCSQYQP